MMTFDPAALGVTPPEFDGLGVVLYVAVLLIAYFLGNISPSTIIAKAHGIDIKKAGSGNAGTTNALRVLGKKAGALTLVIDVCKGVCAVLIGKFVGLRYAQLALAAANLYGMDIIMDAWSTMFAMGCGLFVMLGHIWPLLLKFKGGKGVATAFGVLVTLNPWMGLAALGVVIIVVLITRMVSAGSACGALAVPFLAYFLMPEFVVIGSFMALIVLIKHRANIKRIINKTESKLF